MINPLNFDLNLPKLVNQFCDTNLNQEENLKIYNIFQKENNKFESILLNQLFETDIKKISNCFSYKNFQSKFENENEIENENLNEIEIEIEIEEDILDKFISSNPEEQILLVASELGSLFKGNNKVQILNEKLFLRESSLMLCTIFLRLNLSIHNIIKSFLLLSNPECSIFFSVIISINSKFDILEIERLIKEVQFNESYTKKQSTILQRIVEYIAETCCDESQKRDLRKLYLDLQIWPDSIFYITINLLHDELFFLSQILLDSKYSWIVKLIQAMTKEENSIQNTKIHTISTQNLQFPERKELFTKFINNILDSVFQSTKNANSGTEIGDFCFQFSVFCRAIFSSIIILNRHKLIEIIDLITPSLVGFSRRTSELILCFLVLNCRMWGLIDRNEFRNTISYLLDYGECPDVLICTALYFHHEKYQEVIKIIRSLLSQETQQLIEKKPQSSIIGAGILEQDLIEFGKVFISQNLFSKEYITQKGFIKFLDKIDVSTTISSQEDAFEFKVIRLLLNHPFAQNAVDVSNWIVKKIQLSKFPVNLWFIDVIDRYIQSIFKQISSRIPESVILQEFEQSSSHDFTASQVLFLYYLCSFESNKNQTNIRKEISKLGYSNNFINSLPFAQVIFWLNTKLMNQNHESFEILFSRMSSKALSLFPYLFGVEELLRKNFLLKTSNHDSFSVYKLFQKNDNDFSTQTIKTILDIDYAFQNPLLVISFLENYLIQPISLFKETKDVIISSLISLILFYPNQQSKISFNKQFQKEIEKYLAKIWRVHFDLFSLEASVYLVNELQSNKKANHKIRNDDLMKNPLIIFDCFREGEIFRNPFIVGIILEILWQYLSGSQKMMREVSIIEGTGKEDKKEQLETTILIQNSLVFQSLIEVILNAKKMNEQKNSENIDFVSEINESMIKVFQFIHNMFIEDSVLVKLVHFQMYSRDALELAVEHIPSIHVCFDFIPELLNDNEKFIFATRFCGYLAKKYPTPQALHVSMMIPDKVRDLLITETSELNVRDLVDGIVDMAFAFPSQMGKPVINILLELSNDPPFYLKSSEKFNEFKSFLLDRFEKLSVEILSTDLN
ncbi:integrator complex subunit 2 [Anaeramoeba ignava]|uniref:Integrator complex subunit 2 n=1 Tax=Anaeramoeba ignava TaxID=1746090 RepID=A0A9Q0RBG6_ANAIG|nr:integrator complex subunit 2 [Anaeramoeba ignava]